MIEPKHVVGLVVTVCCLVVSMVALGRLKADGSAHQISLSLLGLCAVAGFVLASVTRV